MAQENQPAIREHARGVIKKKCTGREGSRFGFVAIEGYAGDIFFHENELVGITFEEMMEGDTVTFDMVSDSRRGPYAIDLQRA